MWDFAYIRCALWACNTGPVFSYKLRYIVGFWLVEMAILTNQKPCTKMKALCAHNASRVYRGNLVVTLFMIMLLAGWQLTTSIHRKKIDQFGIAIATADHRDMFEHNKRRQQPRLAIGWDMLSLPIERPGCRVEKTPRVCYFHQNYSPHNIVYRLLSV